MNKVDDINMAKPSASASMASRPLARVDSSQLLDGRRELIIVHRGEEYRLRVTRQEKLILTK